MSKIGPLERNPLANAEYYAALNEPAHTLRTNDVSQVEPVRSSARQELLGDRREIEPAVDSDTDKLVLQVVDRGTKEVVFQSPSEITLRLARASRQQRVLAARRRGPA